MARWRVSPSTAGNTLVGTHEYEADGSYRTQIVQDVSGVLEQAHEDRQESDGKSHYTKMYSIPDVIAIEINNKWGINVFDPGFMFDKEAKTKVHLIVQQHYPKLMSSNKSFV